MNVEKAIRHALISSRKRMSRKQFRIVRFEFETNKNANTLSVLSHNVDYIITKKPMLLNETPPRGLMHKKQ